jgi:hypothetical protein
VGGLRLGGRHRLVGIKLGVGFFRHGWLLSVFV